MEIIAQQGPSAQPAVSERYRLQISIFFLTIGIASATLMSWRSVTQMVELWLENSAYNHGLVILPIALYMAWERRYRLKGILIKPYWPGLVVVTGFALVWVVAHGAAIGEGEQFAYIGIVQGLILTLLGRKFFRAQLLPILYLLLMVPTGTFLLPGMQVIAAWLTEQLMLLTSIPFFVDGLYFQLPVGLFFIAPGCAGLNFLLAALALSIVYADLVYEGWQRKLTCILAWLIIAILANGMRIFLILVIAEISDKQLAIVDDHILYGWGFFLIILMILMWIGRYFSNIHPMQAGMSASEWLPSTANSVAPVGIAAVVSIGIVSAVMGFGLLAFAKGEPNKNYRLEAASKAGEWNLQSETNELTPRGFRDADASSVLQIANKRYDVTLYAAYYNGQWEGHEPTNDNDNIFGEDFRLLSRSTPELNLKGVPYAVQERRVEDTRENLLIWRWYCTDNMFLADPMKVRMTGFQTRLSLRPTQTIVFTLLTRDSETAVQDMTNLLEALSDTGQSLMVINGQTGVGQKATCW